MKTLTLPLKKKWFDMIKAGIKKEEYRDIKPRYLQMFCETTFAHGPIFMPVFSVDFSLHSLEELGYDTLVFTLGYPKADDSERRLVFKNPRIRIDEGKPEWGAEQGKQYFVITWEDKCSK